MTKGVQANSKKKVKVDLITKRAYLKQSDVPGAALDEALRIPRSILENYAGKGTSPLYVAKALNVDPKGAQFRLLSGASIAFGLIEGGAQASNISVTELAKRILKPKVEGDDLIARREAVLTPRVFKEFLTNYDGHPFPRQDIALNILEGMGVPQEKSSEVLERIENSARSVGFIEEIKDKPYISLQGTTNVPSATVNINHPLNAQDKERKNDEDIDELIQQSTPTQSSNNHTPNNNAKSSLATAIANDERRRKVFITHGKNRELVDPIKKLLEYGELVPIVSVERQSVSKPVPEKVMDDMRTCGAAIIHVDADVKIVDKNDQEHVLINPNVLIEIGAAMAFYGRRFILLVKDGVKLPSNLQGLYEVRYSNDTLDAAATIKLLEAIKDIKNYSLPSEVINNDI